MSSSTEGRARKNQSGCKRLWGDQASETATWQPVSSPACSPSRTRTVMAIGTREQPEKWMDGKSARHISRKWHKTMQNRKDRRLAKADPETPKRPKYHGYEW